ncbi:imidazolonepropionase-like amidohydrolase [Microbacterium halimionae]|uniref:Imidazolonepropionase-like amidohydrolase n=1 Tax=Microbacterium halimionae TaxID=1526413 RepID=A0A7W3JMG6_9MICO|nr:amidohydrolase family protein [Microbacterium halimionae]MBA8815567.1 imidazolonepropionase-like amidohydrolase [Microbacterium halimionae]NII95613.1 imidazolonepropionase-like amidohydrolase [Microbacterium halimionae]
MTTQTLAITNVTLIDGLGGVPVRPATILVADGRFLSSGRAGDIRTPEGAEVVDGTGKWMIPGFVNGNVHLLDAWMFMVGPGTIEYLARWEGRYVEVIEEAAQLVLRNGVTTVFDTYNAVDHVLGARDRINAGTAQGARIFAAGAIVGMGGPFSADFHFAGRRAATQSFVNRIDAQFEAGVGHQLSLLPRKEVRAAVRDYLQRGVDLLKIAVSDHIFMTVGLDRSYQTFSRPVLDVIVEEARAAGVPVLTHSLSVEALETSVELGADVLIHANYTMGQPYPHELVDKIVASDSWAELQTVHEQHRHALEEAGSWAAVLGGGAFSENERTLIGAGAKIIMGTDAGCSSNDHLADLTEAEREDRPWTLGNDHFHWTRSMVEKGMTPLEAISAATINVARSYGKADTLGSIESGKLADFVLLDADPTADIRHLRAIDAVYKDGERIERDALPTQSLVTGHPA